MLPLTALLLLLTGVLAPGQRPAGPRLVTPLVRLWWARSPQERRSERRNRAQGPPRPTQRQNAQRTSQATLARVAHQVVRRLQRPRVRTRFPAASVVYQPAAPPALAA